MVNVHTDVIEYVQSKGWKYKIARDEIVCECPFCQKADHFYISIAKEVYHCKRCESRGHMFQLKKYLGDLKMNPDSLKIEYKRPKPNKAKDLHNAIYDNELVYKFLREERCFTDESIKKFQLGCEGNWVSIPYAYNNSNVNIKYRNAEKKDWKREKDCVSTLYNIDNARVRPEEVYLTEGEFDCIAGDQLGFNCVSVPNGMSSFDETWLKDLHKFETIICAYDNDSAGESGYQTIRSKIGAERCRRIYLPLKDFNDCLKAGMTKEEIIKESKIEKQDTDVIHISECFPELDKKFYNKETISGTKTGISSVDNVFGGVREAELTIVTGETGSGKTTWCLFILYQMMLAGKKILICSSEMSMAQVLAKMFSIHLKKDFRSIEEDEFKQCKKEFALMRIYCTKEGKRYGEQDVMSGMEYASMFLGVDIVLLDHLHFFIRQKDPEYERQAIDNFVRSITILTKKLKVHTFLICHPSKLYKTNAPVGMNDLKGSSEIKQDADNVISIWRDKEHENSQTGEYPMQIIFDKIRQDGFCEGKIGMLFNIGSNHYTGLSKENYKERFGK